MDLKDGLEIEISRKSGVPMYFRMTSSADLQSLLTLLCSYYRLSEKWNFSLSTEVGFPVLERLSASKVHGPISKSFAEDKLRKGNFAKGSFLLRQCLEDHNKILLLYCTQDGRRPVEVVIREDEDGLYRLEEAESLPAPLRSRFRAVGDLVRAVRVTASQLELTTPVHPSEFDKDRGLLLCRYEEDHGDLDHVKDHALQDGQAVAGGQPGDEAPQHREGRHQRRGPGQNGGDPAGGEVLLGLERKVVQEQRRPGQGGGHQAAAERLGAQPPAPVHRDV